MYSFVTESTSLKIAITPKCYVQVVENSFMAKRKRELVPRQRQRRAFRRDVTPSRDMRKCEYCQMNLPMPAIQRKAHTDVCMGINVSTSHTSEEREDEGIHVPGTNYVEDDPTTDDAQDKYAWMGDDTNDDVFIDDEDAGTNHNYDVEQDDVQAWMEALAQRGTLSTDHIVKYMHWGPLPLTQQETDVAEFLSTVTGGVGMSEARTNKLLKFWIKKNGPGSMPASEETCWNILERAHERMTASVQRRSVTVQIPDEVQALLYERMECITWDFWNPCELLIRMLTMGPLSAQPSVLALFPVESEYLDDFCHGDKMKRIFAAIPRNTSCLSSILYFDEINRDQKGYATGDGAIVVGAFFNKEARNSTYAKASFGTFPKLNIPKVAICFCALL